VAVSFDIPGTIMLGESESKNVEMLKSNDNEDALEAHPSRIVNSAPYKPTVSFTEFMQGLNRVTAG
jgi:hypothetical protein